MSDLVNDINSFITQHNSRRTQQHASDALPAMLPSYYAPSLMLQDTEPNGIPDMSTASISTSMTSLFDRSLPQVGYDEPHRAALPRQSYVGPAPLVCEFTGIGKCDKAFESRDEAGWITHIAKDHLNYRFPTTCICWFCDHRFRASSHSQSDTETSYRKRMHHIAKHLRNGLLITQMRPDLFFLEHLYKNGLVNDETFHETLAYHEAPVLGLYPAGWRGPYKCDQCMESFSRKHDLERHKRVHLKAKAFPNRPFSRKDDLTRQRHVKGCGPKGEIGEAHMEPGHKCSDLTSDCKPGSHIGIESSLLNPNSISHSSNDSASLNLPSQDNTQSQMVKLETDLSEEATETFTTPFPSNYTHQHGLPIVSKRSDDLESRGSSQIPPSDGSSYPTETYVDERKTQIIDSIVSKVTQWMRSMFDSCRKGAGGNSAGASGRPDESQGSSSKAKTSNPTNPSNQKRKATEIDDGETDDDDEEEHKEDRKSGKKPVQNCENRKYACPYFKYNPTKYREWRVCPGPGWADIHRLKEHLYRRHRQPKHRCGRCWQPFKDEQCYLDHLRTEEACPLREMEHVEGFDEAQERSLKSRKRHDRELSEDDKWRRVFKILFPHVLDDDIPSPYYEYNQTSQKEKRCQHSESDYLAQCEDYMVREVPQRLRQALGRELDRDLTIVEESLRRKAGDWVKTLLEEAFRELRHNRDGDGQSLPSEESGFPIETPSILASQAGNSANGNLPYERQSEAWLSNFNLDSLDPFMLLGETEFSFDNGGLLEDLLGPGESDDSATRKQSDSGYDSYSCLHFEKEN